MKINRMIVALAYGLFFYLFVGCGGEMSIPKAQVNWPLTGGLDTKKDPLLIQPGSFLRLDDVRQPLAGQWKTRAPFTKDAADQLPEVNPYFAGNLGDAGVIEMGTSGVSTYSPSLASSRWRTPAIVGAPVSRKLTALNTSDLSLPAFAQVGNVVVVTSKQTSQPSVISVIDKTTAAVISSVQIPGTAKGTVAIATTTHIAVFVVDNATGNLNMYIVTAATGAISVPVTIGTATTSGGGVISGRWYGGDTVTLAFRTFAGSILEVMEINPATATVVSNVTVPAVSVVEVELLDDNDNTGVRFAMTSSATQVQVTRLNSSGGVIGTDLVEAVTGATNLAGVATELGAGWNVVYNIFAGGPGSIHVNNKTAGVVGVARNFQGAAWGITAIVESSAWREPLTGGWSAIIGLHSRDASDPQDTWVEYVFPIGNSTANAVPVSTIVPLSAAFAAGRQYQVQRTASGRYSFVLPVLVIFEDNAGTIVRHFSNSLFEESYLTGDDLATAFSQRKPERFRQTSFVSNGQLWYYNEGTLKRHGTQYRPRKLTLSASTGAGQLTLLGQYRFVAVVEDINSAGEIWRSPPSAPAVITLTGTQNTVSVTYSSWGIDGGIVRVGLYGTDANGSAYKRFASFLAAPGADVVTVDVAPDANPANVLTGLDAGEGLYTTGNVPPTQITPPPKVFRIIGSRAFLVNAEYPTELWYSRLIAPGHQPEFVDVNVNDIVDGKGGMTAIGNIDGKVIVFKQSSISYLVGDGRDNGGGGQDYIAPQVERDTGAIEGSPVVETGSLIFFVSERGIYSIDKTLQTAFVGAPVDLYLHQPDAQTPETIFDGEYISSTNEVVFATTNYLLRYDLTFGYWVRNLISGVRHVLSVNDKLVIIKNDGSMWRESDGLAVSADDSAFSGRMRSPWIRQASIGQVGGLNTQSQDQMVFYRGRINYSRPKAGTVTTLQANFYRDNDDSTVEQFTSDPVQGATLTDVGEFAPLDQKCSSFSIELLIPASDTTLRVDGFSATVGLSGIAKPVDGNGRWK